MNSLLLTCSRLKMQTVLQASLMKKSIPRKKNILQLVNLNELKSSIEPIAPVNASITFYKTLDDFFAESNALGESYINDKPYLEMIYVKVKKSYNHYSLKWTIPDSLQQYDLLNYELH